MAKYNLEPVDVTKECLTSSNKYNKVVSNLLLNDIWTFSVSASEYALSYGGVDEYQITITSWTNPSAGYYYKDVDHSSVFSSKDVTVQITKLDTLRVIEPKKIINSSTTVKRIVISEDIDVRVNIQG